ncbi:MAG: hypothetical protein Ct9H300mP11_26880 [Chloroflexota bacterium]|nr:MAG: hypothetical protein Ct9H300mP11_26880 [Chloroflexota bacterium]
MELAEKLGREVERRWIEIAEPIREPGEYDVTLRFSTEVSATIHVNAEKKNRKMYAEKLLPHDLEAEEAVVGSVLIDGDCFSRIAPHIKADDFYRERNQLCFAACEALFQRDEAIDQVTLARELSRASQLETVGGMAISAT